MRRVAAALALAVVSGPAWPALAGETGCWIDNGAVVVPAVLAQPGLGGDITGDFILDLSAPRSQLHQTAAQSAGMADATQAQGLLTLAGEHIAANLAVADLDDRQWGFPTSLSGLIGADVLAGYVVELRFSPCRLTLRRRAPAAVALARLPVTMIGGVPTIAASIFDGTSRRSGQFAVDTGAAGIRIAAAHARFSRLSARVDPLSRDRPPARLAALSLGGRVLQNQPAALQEDMPAGVLGGIGTDVWSRYVLRLDLGRDRLSLIAPARVSGPRSSRSPGSSRRAGRRRSAGR